ncbi:LuxQ periplasmic sensor domain-containing protein [Vibrio rarus]|uniref:LuxQ periplasmic sensor domain-containing protein n=1 Tax=Vibrio rarus TaxID=413403 RepID=UPI0021C3F88C|nr:LuxQ periplasmic sensor domain-containing protein [Vibrio rarus]
MKLVARKKSLTAQIIRVSWISWFVVIVGFVFYNYQLGTKTFETELERNFNQTARIVKQLMENRLQTIQVTQDITAKSTTLIDLFDAKNYQAIDNYMLKLEEFDPNGASDFRFIYRYGDLAWDDGSAAFYGLTHAQLLALGEKVDFNNSWYFLGPSVKLGNKHIMIRRSPFINPKSGEVVGHYYVGLVMDNNVSFLRDVVIDADVSEIMLVEGGEIIASSSPVISKKLQQNEPVKLADQTFFSSEMMSQVDVMVGGVVSPIHAVFIQNTSRLDTLEVSFAASLLFALLAVTASAIAITRFVQRRVEKELTSVMVLADSFDSVKKQLSFKGSNIIEFDRLGNTLLQSILREKQKETSFKNLFNFALLPTVLFSNNKNILELNPAAIEAFENDRHAVALKTHLDQHLDFVLQTQKHTEVDISLGEQIYRWSIVPILVEGAAPTLVVQGRNITQFIEAERQSERARKEAEQTAATRAEFLAKVSHEIRTPLNGILGMAQLLAQNVQLDEQKVQVQILNQSSEHLLNMLNDILDFSRIDSGGLTIEQLDFPLNQVIKKIESFAQPSCMQKGLKFSLVRNFDDSIIVHSDQLRLTQILLNLLSNAIKFTARGAVSVDVQLRSGQAGRQELYFSVRDTGIGIAEDRLESVFLAFTQADITISREYGGTGLGLSIVQSLVSHLEGDITVESQLDSGSCFSVTMPIKIINEVPIAHDDGHQCSVKGGQIVPAAWFEPRKIQVLLVEDNKTNASVIQALGKRHGLVFDWVTDGLQAIEKVKTNTYDVIFMDNQMPFMDGIEVTQKLREHWGVTTPIIACTADGYQSTADAFMSAGANAVLVKPILEDNLLLTLQQVLESAQC